MDKPFICSNYYKLSRTSWQHINDMWTHSTYETHVARVVACFLLHFQHQAALLDIFQVLILKEIETMFVTVILVFKSEM